MKRIVRILGLAMVLSALLVVSITGAVFAANPEKGNGNLGGEEAPYGDCVCEECPCGECIGEPVENEWDWDWSEQEDPSGPHGSSKYGNID